MSFAEALVKAIDGRDAYTAGHSKAVAEYSRDIAQELGLSREEAARIHLCGLVHDIGKIGVRAEVLEKQAALDEGEWEEMRRHSAIGEAILLEVPGYADMAEVVRSHHERWDGAGYPDNLRGEQIPRLARLIAVADSYNAMTSNRPYRRAMSPERRDRAARAGEGQPVRGRRPSTRSCASSSGRRAGTGAGSSRLTPRASRRSRPWSTRRP